MTEKPFWDSIAWEDPYEPVDQIVDTAKVLGYRLAGGWIPFADDELGDYYLLDRDANVFLWLHEREFDDPDGTGVSIVNLGVTLRGLISEKLVDPGAG
jgi:hypothetical protein